MLSFLGVSEFNLGFLAVMTKIVNQVQNICFTVICPLPYGIRYPPLAICHQESAFCRLPPAYRLLRSAICHPFFIVVSLLCAHYALSSLRSSNNR
jgi:hypothetical protein